MAGTPDTVKLTFLGDLMCLAPQVTAMRRTGSSFDDIFVRVKHLWADSDYVMANLETPVAGTAHGYSSGPMSFNAPIAFLKAIKDAGIDFVSLANNHCLDRGFNGLDETIRCIRDLELDSSGAYLTEEDSRTAFVKTLRNGKMAIVCSTYGINGCDASGLPEGLLWKVDTLTKGSITHVPTRFEFARKVYAWIVPEWVKSLRRAIRSEVTGRPSIGPIADSIHPRQIGRDADKEVEGRIRNKIEQMRGQTDIIVSFPHIGGQYNPAPGAFQKYTMDWMADAGADMIIANHAHRPLRGGYVNERTFAAFALGNFCFTPGSGYYLSNVLADYSIVLNVFFDMSAHRIVKITFHTVRSVIRQDGVAVVMPVCDLYADTRDTREREFIAMENEAVVNCFAGKASSVEILPEYAY